MISKNRQEKKKSDSKANDLAASVYLDLLKEKNRSRNTVRIGAIGMASVVGMVLLYSFGLVKNASNVIYGISQEGTVYKMEKKEPALAVLEDATFHMDYWFSAYYTFDYSNMKDKRIQGLQLIDDEDGSNLEKKWTNWYSTIATQSLSQETTFNVGSLQFKQVSSKTYQMACTAKMELFNSGFKNVYELTVTSYMTRVERDYPHNPHGFTFFDYRDNLELKERNVNIKK
ncbi:MAG: hypothetical protein AAGA64_08700 [Bacteroidota bacterium]